MSFFKMNLSHTWSVKKDLLKKKMQKQTCSEDNVKK